MEHKQYAGRLEITTRIGCKVNCVYCPQKLLVTRYTQTADALPVIEMSFETFRACVDKVPQETRIDFSGMAEPWLNPECTRMVQYAAEKGHPIAVYTTLIGMNDDDFDRLSQIPLEEFVLHIPDDKSNSHIDVTPEYIALLEKAIHAQRDGLPIVTGYSCHAGIHPAILAAIPKDGNLITELHDRAGNVSSQEVEHARPEGEILCINCEDGVNHNVLLPDGRVVLCCMDYGLQHVLGNLLHQSWEEIHRSEEALRVIRGMKDPSLHTLCRSCVNAKNIHEVYDEYRLYHDWTRGLLKNEDEKAKDLAAYHDWVDKLERQNEQLAGELEKSRRQRENECAQAKQREAELARQKCDLEVRAEELRSRMENLQTEMQFVREKTAEQKECSDRQIEQLTKTLNDIHASHTYRIFNWYRRWRDRENMKG